MARKEGRTACLPRVQAVAQRWSKVPLDTTITSTGELIIQPRLRKAFKDELMQALAIDLMEGCPEELEVLKGPEGHVLVVQHEEEGCICLKFNVQVKGLDYDPYELNDAVGEAELSKPTKDKLASDIKYN